MLTGMPTYMWPIFLAFIGALIVAVGTAFTREGWPRYAILSGSVLTALGVMWIGVNQVGYNTGGDSFIYLEPQFMSPGALNAGMADIWVRHHGLYPVYDTSITIVDLEKLAEARKEPNGMEKYIGQYEHYRHVERLDRNKIIRNFDRWQLPKDADHQGYTITFSSRNGSFVQALRFRRINGKWAVSMQVTHLFGRQTFLEQGLEFLPRDEKGQPKW